MSALVRIWVGATAALLPDIVLAAAEAEHGGGHGGGNPVRVDLWQAGYTIAIFVMLLLVLRKFAFKPIVEGLAKREKFIRDSVEAAQRAREQADARMREYEARLAAARAEATAIVEEGRRDAEQLRRRIEEEARTAGEAMIERARREIGLARDTALKAIYDQAAELATSLAATVLKRKLSPEEHQRLMGEALRELAERPDLRN